MATETVMSTARRADMRTAGPTLSEATTTTAGDRLLTVMVGAARSTAARVTGATAVTATAVTAMAATAMAATVPR